MRLMTFPEVRADRARLHGQALGFRCDGEQLVAERWSAYRIADDELASFSLREAA